METTMDRADVDTITSHFRALTSLVPLHPIRSEQDYDRAVAVLNQLLDAGVVDEQHALADLATMLGTLIAAYDDAHYPVAPVPPVAMLRFLMNQNQLTDSALPELGSQSTVAEVLNGTRELDTRQIKALAARFQVPASLFL
jgi:HTH-type transcriptional regulator/antitoxin HigA